MAVKKTSDTKTADSVSILEVENGQITACVLGTRPMILNRLSEKVKHELLMPKPKKNAAERATSMKHDPYAEFLSSPHRLNAEDAATYLAVPAAAFKKGMMTAALDLPGTKKAQIGRLVWVEGDLVELYGIPQITLDPVRSADMNRTPDIRSRAIVPQWACKVSVTFVKPLMNAQAVTRLLMAAGLYIGVGDWRNEKGSGTFGAFKLVDPEDQTFNEIIAAGGRAKQIEAMKDPVAYDENTTELLSWFDSELTRRQIKGVASKEATSAAAGLM